MAEENEQEASPDADTSRLYELGYHVIPTVSEDAVGEVVERLRGIIESHGGTVVTEGYPQRIQLAYTMEYVQTGQRQRFTEAHFGWIQFEVKSHAAPEIDAAVRADSDILRHLLITTTRDTGLPAKRISKPQEMGSNETNAQLSDEDLDKHIEEMVKE